jgi:glycogen synthase
MSATKRPRILIVTPEITYLPSGMGNYAQRMSAKAGGLADVSASLVSALFELGADVHVALPNYRRMFQGDVFNFHEKELRKYYEVLPDAHIHLAEDRIFYYREQVYSNYSAESMHIALVFQREVINHIVPSARPDLIHCNDWMTGLIPGMARRRGIKTDPRKRPIRPRYPQAKS